MTYSLDELDPETLDYLRRAESEAAHVYSEVPGVVVPGGVRWFAGPRGGWEVLLVLAALLFAGAVVCAVAAPGLPAAKLRNASAGTALGLGLGVLCLAAGCVRFRRPAPSGPRGDLVFADSAQLWIVRNRTVRAVEYGDDLEAAGDHSYQNGAHLFTSLVVRTRGVVERLTLESPVRAERLLRFLNAVGRLRRLDDPTIRSLAEQGSARVGQIALYALDDLDLDHASADRLVDPPRPRACSPAAPQRGWAGVGGRATGAALVGVGAYLVAAPAFDYVHDERLFAKVPRPVTGTPAEHATIEHYLAEHPGGRHAAETAVMRDDSAFAIAEKETAGADSPAGLRRYLAVPANTRHRAEAVEKIGAYYDRTVAELRKRAADNPGKIDRALMDPLTTLIGSLKGLNDPVVTVGFVAEIQPDPQTAEEKEQEQAVYLLQMRSEPRLNAVADRAQNKSAILPYQQAFDAESVAAREKVIYERLTGAVQKAIKADVLTLRPVPPGEQPMIEVRYKIVPSGSLYLYTSTVPELLIKTVKGLIRGYTLKWEIVVRPPGAPEPLRYTVASQPLSALNYDPESTDPEWAPYAILLYSAFYDLSDRMIRAFALDPGPAPNAFTFRATAATKPIPPELPDFNAPRFKLPDFTPPGKQPKRKVNPATGEPELEK